MDKERIRKWIKRHQRLIRFVAGIAAFAAFMFFSLMGYGIFYQIAGPDAGIFEAATFAVVIAGYFFRLATDFHDWEQRPEYQSQIDSLSEELQDFKNQFIEQ